MYLVTSKVIVAKGYLPTWLRYVQSSQFQKITNGDSQASYIFFLCLKYLQSTLRFVIQETLYLLAHICYSIALMELAVLSVLKLNYGLQL